MAEAGMVYVIDDDPSMCDLISSTLAHEGLHVRTFSSAQAFLEAVAHIDPAIASCILLDLELPGISGLEFLEQRFAGHSPCPVIIISARGSISSAVKSMKLGAVDFLEKPFSTDTLKTLVLDTLKKHQVEADRSAKTADLRSRLAALSPRERQLLEAIIQGRSTKMIADLLGISARTVDHHRANLMDKMQATNVADLVRMAIQADFHNTDSAKSSNTPAPNESPAHQ